jgi:3',5'-cyclic AMP phosphodiesterase CpdA
MLNAVARRARILILPASLGVALVAASPAASQDAPYTFVSIPDFLNADIGDTREAFHWKPGDPNSINVSYRASLDAILDNVQAELPSDVFVAGDMVEGHWGEDVDKSGIFGPVRSFEQRKAAIRRAAHLYYSQWKRRFSHRGLPVHTAVGDHEIGDLDKIMPARGSFQYRVFNVFKQAYKEHFGPTYYAKDIGNSLLITLDVFSRDEQSIKIRVGEAQLDWLRQTLASTTATNIIVQAHTPILGPVNTYRSSGLMYPNGRNSRLWQVMVRGGVDLYLCGEVHDVTVTERDGIMQIAHGSLIAGGRMNYLVGTIYPDHIDLELKRINGTRDTSRKLWHTSAKRPPIRMIYSTEARSVWGPTTRPISP